MMCFCLLCGGGFVRMMSLWVFLYECGCCFFLFLWLFGCGGCWSFFVVVFLIFLMWRLCCCSGWILRFGWMLICFCLMLCIVGLEIWSWCVWSIDVRL